VSDVAASPRSDVFTLEGMSRSVGDDDSNQASVAISEPKAGTVLLLRTASQSQARDIKSSIHQIFAFTDGRKFGPFDADDFQNFGKTETAKRVEAAPSKRRTAAFDDLTRYTTQGFTWLELSGGVVVLNTFRPPGVGAKGLLVVDSFVFDERKSPQPFRRGFVKANFDFEFNQTLGLISPLFVDGYLLLPKARGGDTNDGPQLVRYDLRRGVRGDGQGIELQDMARLMKCQGPCQWQLIPSGREPSALLIFGALRPGQQIGQRSVEQLGLSDLKDFDRFVVADVLSGRAIAIDAGQLLEVRKSCAHLPASELEQGISTKFFMAGTVDDLVIGFPAARVIDIVRASASGEHTCVGTFMMPDDIKQWTVSGDGAILLGVGPSLAASWDIKQNIAERTQGLVRSGDLSTVACRSSLKDYKPSAYKWKSEARLEAEPELCAIPAPGSERTAATQDSTR